MYSIACIFFWNPNILPIFDVRTWWEDPETRPYLHVSVDCVLILGKTCTSPLLSRLCAPRGVKQVFDFESSFCQAASKKRQRFGYCTCEKCGSLHTHLIFMHSKKPAGTLFHSWIQQLHAIGNARISPFFQQKHKHVTDRSSQVACSMYKTWAGAGQAL